eukprot:6484475-Pyramimonas_sp.AAC.1
MTPRMWKKTRLNCDLFVAPYRALHAPGPLSKQGATEPGWHYARGKRGRRRKERKWAAWMPKLHAQASKTPGATLEPTCHKRAVARVRGTG